MLVSSPGTCCVGKREEPWVTTDFSLSMFHQEHQHAQAAYHRFVHARLDAASPLKERNPNDTRILGNDTFVASLGRTTWRPKSQKTLNTLVDEACTQFSVDQHALLSPNRKRHLTYVRAWIAHQAITLQVASLAQVATLFNRNEASLRESVKTHFNYP